MDDTDYQIILRKAKKMEKKSRVQPSRNRNVFKGSVLVSLLIESHPRRFPNRAVACKLARRLFKEGHIRSIFGAKEFEDSAQLYVWQDDDVTKHRHGRHAMTSPTSSSCSNPVTLSNDRTEKEPSHPRALDWQLIQDIKSKVLNRSETYNIVTSYNTFFQELERDFGYDHSSQSPRRVGGGGLSGSEAGWSGSNSNTPYTSTLELKKDGGPYFSTEKIKDSNYHHHHYHHHPQQEKQNKQNSRGDENISAYQKQSKKHTDSLSPNSKDLPSKSTHSPSRSKDLSPHRADKSLSSPRGQEISPDRFKNVPPHIKQQLLQNQDSQVHNPYQQYQHRHRSPGRETGSTGAVSPERRQQGERTSSEQFSPRTHKSPSSGNPRVSKDMFEQEHGSNRNLPGTTSSADANFHPSSSSVLKSNVNKNNNEMSSRNNNNNMLSPVSNDNIGASGHRGGWSKSSGPNSEHRNPSTAHFTDQTNNPNRTSKSDREGRYPTNQLYNHTGTDNKEAAVPHINTTPKSNTKKSEWQDHRQEQATLNGNERESQLSHDIVDNGQRWMDNDVIISTGVDNDVARGALPDGHQQLITNLMENNDRRWPDSDMVSSGVDSGRRWPDPEMIVSGESDPARRWPESANSYSDNEKQLLEEMRRMKKEHQNVLRTYEGRINKLMAKMHELRNIAEMLENSSSKSSPYGVLPGKMALLNILADKDEDEKKEVGPLHRGQVPPPLPPRPGRGLKVYPNKPIIHTSVAMRALPWSRIILEEYGTDSGENTVWHGMTEPKIDTEELERLFTSAQKTSEETSLYEDICLRRGRTKTPPTSVYDTDRSQRISSELKALHCTLPQVVQAFVTLNCGDLHTDSFAELLELLTSPKELDKIQHIVRRKGANNLDIPEFLVFELSKVDHFRERLEFLRFKNKLQINLFEIDQQLRELHTACEEITTSLSLKHVLETVLAVGNHMNGGSDRGQADGFRLDVLNTLKEMQDQTKRGNLLELIMRIYCLKFESDVEFGCPKRFRLPEPSNMRHAAQVSFEDIQRALKELKDELMYVRGKLESLSKREGSNLTIALRVTSENFMTSAVEVLSEEQRLLEDTRVYFWKTTAYFSMDGQLSSPHDFFQIWASFLHDCKYYWKLAHRNLAKIKFNGELATKSQLSSSSLPGFNSLKSVMMKHVATFQQDEEMRTTNAQQLQHINSWIESVGRYALEMQPEGENPHLDSNDGRHPDNQSSKRAQSHPYNAASSSSTHYANRPEISGFPQGHEGDYSGDKKKSRKSKHSSYTTDLKPEGMYPPHTSANTNPVSSMAPSSPKPIKATPPNVIKPQPLMHTSPTISSPSPTNPTLPLSLSQPPVEPILSTVDSDETFGFEPPYATLKLQGEGEGFHHIDNQDTHVYPGSSQSSTTNAYPNLNSPSSHDGENSQKKNANFFKAFLKRDQKRTSDDQNPQSPPPSQTSHKGGSTPFNKLRNTFVQKLSGGNSSKKTSDQTPSGSNLLQPLEVPPKPPRGFPVENEPEREEITQDHLKNEQQKDGFADKMTEHVNYQNYFYPGQPRRHEEAAPAPGHQMMTSGLRDGHDSLPSTISSLHSLREASAQKYRGNLLHNQNWRDGERVSAFNQHIAKDESNSDVNNNQQQQQTPDLSKEDKSKARVRAPIALGSNISISDIYGKATEAARAENPSLVQVAEGEQSNTFQNNYPKNRASSDGSKLHTTGVPSSDSKWVKATAVPVYKAKLIPNYENQTKLEPWLEGGVRGTAEAPTTAIHVQQPSNSSDIYRQELQKKSEQFVGGGVYPSLGQISTSKTNSIPGMPTSYTIMPPKPIHYRASPIMIGQDGIQYDQFSHSNLITSSGHSTDPLQSSQVNSPHSSVALKDDNHNEEVKNEADKLQNFTISPDGRLQVELRSPTSQADRQQKEGAAGHRNANRQGDRNYEEISKETGMKSAGSMELLNEGRVSRRDGVERQSHWTSEQGQSQIRGWSHPPQSVNSLIDRFELRPDQPPGLLDIDDKPPSMTSTPLVKRKNQGGSETASFSSASRSESSRSRSATQKKTTDNDDGAINAQTKNEPIIQGTPSQSSKPHQQSQPVAPFLIQGSSPGTRGSSQNIPVQSMTSPQQHNMDSNLQTDSRNQRSSSSQKPYHGHREMQRPMLLQTEQAHSGPRPTGHAHSNTPEKDPMHQDKDRQRSHGIRERNQFDQRGIIQTPSDRSHSRTTNDHSHSHTPSDRSYSHTPNERSHSYTPSDRSYSHTPNERSQSHTPSQRPRSDHSSGRRPTSQGHREANVGSYSSPSTNPSSYGAPSSFQGAYLPKPEPQYPSHPKHNQEGPFLSSSYTPQSQSAQHSSYPPALHSSSHQPHVSRSSPLVSAVYPQQKPSSNHGTLQQLSNSTPPRSNYSSLPISPVSQQQLMNSHVSPSTNIRQGNSTQSVNSNSYIDELRRASKSTSSAFDHPLKTSPPYGRQPGALAVVKPTVMHL